MLAVDGAPDDALRLARRPSRIGSKVRAGLAGAAIVLLSACGGGGGGGGGDGGGGGSGPTGFVPAPGALGATLYARGSDVRPVRANAKWYYHSHDFVLGGSDYSVTARPGASANQVIESASDDPGAAAATTTVTLDADGSVRLSAPVSLGGPGGLTLAGFELRSPVRANDQYVLFDGEVSGIDADGDDRADRVKAAYWRTVVGNEPISLPNRTTPTTALRVDSFVVVEVKPSGGGETVRVDLQTSAWYEPGVGLVRLTLPGTTAGRAYDLEDVLTGWDGVTEGRGYITQPDQIVDAMLNPMRTATAAVALPDGVLVATPVGLHRLDRNGVVQATLATPPLPIGYPLLRSSAGVLSPTGTWPAMQLHSFDGQGQYVGPAGSFNFASGRPNTVYDIKETYGAHAANPWLWVAWNRRYAPAPLMDQDEIVVRALAPDGSPAWPELTFPASGQAKLVRISVTAGAATLVWNEPDGPTQTRARTVGIGNAGNVVFDTSPVTFPSQLLSGFSSYGIVPVSDGNTTWLHWTALQPTATFGVFSPEPHGVMLDAAGQPVGGAGAASLLAAVDPAFVDWQKGPIAAEGHLFATGSAYAQVFATDTGLSTHTTYADCVAGAGPLAGTITKSASYRVPNVYPPAAVAPIVFSDRVLILTELGGFTLRPTVIFR